MKYEGSSIESDINFLFNHFDRKIAIGSDHPEWKYNLILKKLKSNMINLSKVKRQNILYKNITGFLGVHL